MPSADYVETVHRELTQIFANEEDPISPPGLKDKGLLESACARPDISLGGVEKYGTKFEKIAALFHSLTKNHAFHNGNKRTAIVTLLTTLYRNDRKFLLKIGDDEIFDFAIRVTADAFPTDSDALKGDALIGAIASWLDANSESLDHSVSAMRVNEFLERCEAAGCEVKKSG
jgi:death-on-curing family protein